MPAFRATGSGKPCRRSGQGCVSAGSTAGAAWVAAGAVSVGETVDGKSAWFPGFRVERDRLVARRDADGLDLLLPLIGVPWLLVSVEQQVAAERAAPALSQE